MFGYFFWTEGRWVQSKPQLASIPAPLRMERGVICEVTPTGLPKEGEGMPGVRRESYEAIPRRPEQQGTEGPALSMILCSLFICYPVSTIPYPCLKHTQSPSQSSVTPRTCSSVTLSPITSNLFTRLLVHLSTCHVTLSFSYPVPLSSLPCPYPVTKKVKPYSFTFFFFPLLSLLIRSRAVTTKTYFVCPP